MACAITSSNTDQPSISNHLLKLIMERDIKSLHCKNCVNKKDLKQYQWTCIFNLRFLLVLSICLFFLGDTAGQFVHPGGLHTQSDLDRMKEKVTAGVHPWIDDWNKLIEDPQAQNTYSAGARANMGSSRQRADADAHAAYLNTIRWYISGDTTYAECAVRICNAWSNAVNQVPTGTDIPGLSGIPIFDFALAAEVLRIYPGWNTTDFNKFKNMMETYWYPVCHDFLIRHNDACISHYWANWDIANTGALIAMGVLCDDTAKFNEGVRYFKEGGGAGNINNAVYHLFSPNLGQWQESGRDQEHAQLGVGMMAYYCQVAYNQGIDLFGYENNKLMAGGEYVAKTNLSLEVPYISFNNCDNVNQKWLSINGIGRIDDRPVWELLYNHYVVLKGLSAPNIQAMASVTRPEVGSTDHLGYGTLTFTLDKSESAITQTLPAAPTGVTATAGVGNVELSWQAASPANAQGYSILRATSPGGPYTQIASWTRSTYPHYTDNSISNDSTYYYVIQASNQAGLSVNSVEVSAIPKVSSKKLPAGWTTINIGGSLAGNATYADVAEHTFLITGSGQLGGVTDAVGGYTYGLATGDFSFSVRLIGMGGSQTGIMARASLSPDSRMYVMKRGDIGWREAGYGSRKSQGATVRWTGGNAYTWVPAWFKLERKGDSINGYESGDGNTWFRVAGDTITTEKLYVGFLATSGSVTASNSSTFDHVNLAIANSVAPAAPTGIIGQSGNTQDTIHWSEVSGASSYDVRRAMVSGGHYELVAANLNVTDFIDTGLINGSTYYYVITASSLNGESIYSTEISLTPELAIPPVPQNLEAASVTLHQVNLKWEPSLTGTYYIIKRMKAINGSYVPIDTITTTQYIDTIDIDSTNTYYYAVSALNAVGESANSRQVRVRSGQYAYYNFEEPDSLSTVALDNWGRHTGNVQSGIQRASGYIGKGIDLDGTSSSYVSLPEGMMDGVSDFTISTWVKPSAISTWQRIFDFGSGTDNYMFLTMSSGSTLRYAIKNGGAEETLNSTGLLSVGVWHHVAVTQAGNVATLYVDGIQAGQNTNMLLNPDSLRITTQNFIGKSQFNDPMLNASVDEFSIYSRALSGAEIEALVPPAAPQDLSVIPGNNLASLSWTASPRSTSYIVKRSDGNDSAFVMIGEVSGTEFIDSTANNCAAHYYTVSAVNQVGEGEASKEASAYLGRQLTGTLIGTEGSWNNNVATTKAAAVDGNVSTFFDAAQGSGTWVGYDLGADSAVVTQIMFAPRQGFASRMTNGVFQGANQADFSDAVDLLTVTGSPLTGVLTSQRILDSNSYRYVRYLSPNNSYGDIAEVQFWGLPATLPSISGEKRDTAEQNQAFSFSIVATPLPSSFTATDLPAGLHMDGCKGVIAGTPAGSGEFSIPVTVSNYFGTTKDTLDLLINASETLPVNWLYFRGTSKNNRVQLNWAMTSTTTATQGGAQRFIIERSSDAVHFLQVGSVAAAGYSAGEDKKYSFADIVKSSGLYYYRIWQQNANGQDGKGVKDGSSQYSKVIKVWATKGSINTGPSNQLAYPNPASNFVYVPGAVGSNVVLMDMTGRLYNVSFTTTGTSRLKVDLSGLSSGNYMIRVQDREPMNAADQFKNYKITVLNAR